MGSFDDGCRKYWEGEPLDGQASREEKAGWTAAQHEVELGIILDFHPTFGLIPAWLTATKKSLLAESHLKRSS